MITVAALYKFTRFDDPEAVRAPLLEACNALGIKGTLLLATEGINGTIAGSAAAIDAILAHIRALPGCSDTDVKFSHAEAMPFFRMKVRVKPEIVTLRVPEVDPTKPGRYVQPADWNALVDDPNVIMIDTRNDYEVAIGTFKGAVNPNTTSFTELPAWVETFKASLPADAPRPKLAMFCTGGIRCEKSTALMKAHGFDDVVHLKGGILKYLEDVPAAESRWQGECFVFDQRVSVGHGLALGTYTSCHACRMPLSRTDIEHPAFEHGVSCPHCYDAKDEAQRARYAERQRQVEKAEAEGREHIGVRMTKESV
jgi:UPF0176 protein